MPTRKRQHGFTIIELMVTLTILGLMLFLVNELFNDTSVAVQTSVQTSKTISTSRSINEQLTQDLDAMIGPGLDNDGGYIVIIQQRIPDATLLDPITLAEVTVSELRTDQLLFIRDGEGLSSMTPARDDSYVTNFTGQPGDRARVWYGHALRTLPNGQRRPGADTELGGVNAGLDRVGNNFIFGRQAMLFNPTSTATNNRLSAAPAGFTYADNAYHASVVNGAAGYTGASVTFEGLSDITLQSYGPGTTPGTMLNQLTNGVSDSVASGTDDADYVNTAYPLANNRLRVNTNPDASDTDYASWAIAQGHPVLAQGCSEIIIDFAADLNGNGRIDRELRGGRDDSGAIHWYDTLDRTPAIPTTSFDWDNPGNGIDPLVSNTANQNIFVFRVDDDEPFTTTGNPVSSWPYLIRIRYRLHDTRGRLAGNYTAALNDDLDNDGDGAIDEEGEDRIAGRWFERIISVPRP